ncbi:hypothetical protein H6763_01085 [Candidatus Nomurabacteria bacterium]|uniref:Uncharacterized protein n=1 Tax=Candidatus Dojkabacteria bacterium TaxID=2099670 RepID=A0A955I2B3_9BACT|nr:hypothetical protein [Candidatus Dojkabacteria bacterium]MCB9790010.1 hypothetical protein [Candidatus Nomurabacteria bacterium]MCB9803403.1 hypothetical protein [Candidatus Nomurabacteria bacterium]
MDIFIFTTIDNSKSTVQEQLMCNAFVDEAFRIEPQSDITTFRRSE